MHIVINFLAAGCLGMGICLLAVVIEYFYRKSSIGAGFQVGCASGDNETVNLSYNFDRNESEASKSAKRREAYRIIADRREENHQIWLRKKDQAIRENEAKRAAEKAAGNVASIDQDYVGSNEEITTGVSETR